MFNENVDMNTVTDGTTFDMICTTETTFKAQFEFSPNAPINIHKRITSLWLREYHFQYKRTINTINLEVQANSAEYRLKCSTTR